MKRTFLKVIILVMLLSTMFNGVGAYNKYYISSSEIYVDPVNGKTNASGSVKNPLKSLEAAVNVAKKTIRRRPTNVTIYLREGRHSIKNTIVLNSDDFGYDLSGITFKNYPGEKPVVTDGIQLDSKKFKKVSGKPYYKFNIPAENGKYPSFRTLMVNGRRAILARSNDMDELNVFQSEKVSSVFDTMDAHSSKFSNKLYVEPELLKGITTENMGSLELCRYVQWLHQRYGVKSINGIEPQTGYVEVTVNQEQWDYNATQWWVRLQEFTGTPYWFENHLAFLDSPGEFYYDEKSGTVYYYPFEDEPIIDSIIEYSPLKTLFELVGTSDKLVRNVSFEGLSFTGLTYPHLNGGLVEGQGNSTAPWDSAAICGNYTSGINVKDCFFNELGVAGIVLVYKAIDTQISGNVFTNLGLSAIRCGYNQRQPFTDRANGLIIDNNYIENIGTDVNSCNAMWIGRMSNVKILHNTVKNIPYSGIAIGWHHNKDEADLERANLINVEIAYNRVENAMSVLYDGGGIYALGSNHELIPEGQIYNLIEHDNYIYGGLTGTYNDNASSYVHLYNNVIERAEIPFSLQSGSEQSRVANLVLEDCYYIEGEKKWDASHEKFKIIGPGLNVKINNLTNLTGVEDVGEKVQRIIDNAGVEPQYKDNIPVHSTDVIVKTNRRILEMKGGEEASFDVTVTNNTKEAESYKLHFYGFPENYEDISETDSIELKPGESKTVKLALRKTDDAKDERAMLAVSVKPSRRGKVYRSGFGVIIEEAATTVNTDAAPILRGTAKLDGKLDEAYKGSLNVKLSNIAGIQVKNGGGGTDINADSYLMYDDDYLYICTEVNDPTLLSRDDEYVMGNDNPYMNDSVENWIDLERNLTRSKISIDAFGKRVWTSNVDKTPEEAGYIIKTTKDKDSYVVEMAIPCELKPGTYMGYSLQVNDILDLTSLAFNASGSQTLEYYPISPEYSLDAASETNEVVEEELEIIDSTEENIENE